MDRIPRQCPVQERPGQTPSSSTPSRYPRHPAHLLPLGFEEDPAVVEGATSGVVNGHVMRIEERGQPEDRVQGAHVMRAATEVTHHMGHLAGRRLRIEQCKSGGVCEPRAREHHRRRQRRRHHLTADPLRRVPGDPLAPQLCRYLSRSFDRADP